MASGKENHRRNSQKQSLGYGSDKFRATKLWKHVVSEFRERIIESTALVNAAAGFASGSSSIAWRGPKKFSGADAVETLTSFLLEKRESLGLKEVTEEKATKFCEILLRDKTIISAAENRNGNRFEASKTAFYYFNDNSNSSLVGQDGFDKENLRRCVTPKSCRNVSVHSSMISLASVEDIGDLDEKIVRDFALSRLLTLVDISILEGILHFRSDDDGNGSVLRTLENLFGGLKLALSRGGQSPDTSATEELPPEEIKNKWTLAAYRCLHFCHISVDMQSIQTKVSLFRLVLDAYKTVTSKRGSLIPPQYDNVLEQIAKLIQAGTNENDAKALEACQCLCLLLPKQSRDQFGSLLQFMVAMKDEELYLHAKMADIDFAKDEFSKFILSKESLDYGRLIHYFVDHATDVLTCPKHFREQAMCRQTILEHTSMEPKPELTFCRRITSEEYQRQKLTATEQSLFDVLSSVVENERMTDQEKLVWFNKFRQEYPKIYQARFPSL